MNIAKDYDHAFASLTPSSSKGEVDKYIEQSRENAKSLKEFVLSSQELTFMDGRSLSGATVLDSGCGVGPLSWSLSELGADVTGVDFSPMGISQANYLSDYLGKKIDFIVHDVTSDKILPLKFDYIIDSHLLHCLTIKSDRRKYFSFINNHLEAQGLFFIETMVFHKEIQLSLDYSLDEHSVLHRMNEGRFKPFRYLADFKDIENELSEFFNIVYMYYHNEKVFVLPSEESLESQKYPRVMRIILRAK